jgi:hypothetical protein
MHFTPTYLDVGFDEMELAEQDGPGRWDDDYHRYLRKPGLVDANDLEDQRSEYRKDAQDHWDTFEALTSNLQEKDHSITWIAERAMETLQKWTAERPALLMVGFIKPHHPFGPPEPWAHMYDPDKTSLRHAIPVSYSIAPSEYFNRLLGRSRCIRVSWVDSLTPGGCGVWVGLTIGRLQSLDTEAQHEHPHHYLPAIVIAVVGFSLNMRFWPSIDKRERDGQPMKFNMQPSLLVAQHDFDILPTN